MSAPQRPLAGTVALVAGGAGGVGEGIVRGLLDAGADVVVPSRDPDRLDALAERLGRPPALHGVRGDVGDPDGAAAVRDEVRERYGRLDAVVASVGGWWQGADVVDAELDVWERLWRNNVRTHVVIARTFVPLLRERPAASYLVVNGDAAESPVAGAGPTASAAAAQLMAARTLAAELAETSVRVNVLLLGPVATRHRAEAPADWLTADEVGRFAAHLAGPGGAMVSGSVIRLPRRPPPSQQ